MKNEENIDEFLNNKIGYGGRDNIREVSYKTIDNETLYKLKVKIDEMHGLDEGKDDYEDEINIWEYIDNIENSDFFGMRIYVALFFLLTGTIPDSEEVDFDFFLDDILLDTHIKNKLHDAIFGTDSLYFDDYEPIRCFLTENNEIPEIVNVLTTINIKELVEIFEPNIFDGLIYPHCWDKFSKETWSEYLIKEYNELLDFYMKAQDKNAHVIIIFNGPY